MACHDAQPSGHVFFSSIPATISSEGGTYIQYFDPPLEGNDIDLRTSDDDSSSDDVSNEVLAYAPSDVDLNRVPILLA